MLLWLWVTLPAFAVEVGCEGGSAAFTLYREPKLVAIMIVGWTLLVALLWTGGARVQPATVIALRGRLELVLLGGFILWLTASLLWVTVIENAAYELNQYLLLFLLLIVLLVWSRTERRVVRVVRCGLITSLAGVTLVGLVQSVLTIPGLIPINPLGEVRFPSLMGYKNPMALALLGQLFLLAQLVFTNRSAGAAWRRFGLILLVLVEVAYLVSLRSRTSYLALSVAALYLAALYLWRQRSRRALVLAGLCLTVLVGAAGTAGFVNPAVRQKVDSVVPYLLHPSSYLESDRGTYLRGTLSMVRLHPMGVGVGDWQTHYPLFSPRDANNGVSEEYQVRRAHSDYVQMLGEAGWPGLAMWLGFLVTLVARSARHWNHSGSAASLFASAQVVAFCVAMSTDYVMELPYGKFQLFVVVFLALSARDEERSEPGHHETGRLLAGTSTAFEDPHPELPTRSSR